MSDTGDRLVSPLYLRQHTRTWQPEIDGLPNQGHLDTSVPAYCVDLDALRRAAGVPVPPTARHEPQRQPLRRRRRSWSWWEVLAFLGIVALIIALVVEPVKTLVTVAAASIPAYVIAVAHRKAAIR